MTITDFLLARIVDDEVHARRINTADQGQQRPRDTNGLYWSNQTEFADLAITKERLLAECEAKRQIITWIAAVDDGTAHPDTLHLGEQTLHWLASTYADHVHYNQEWRP